MLEGFKTYEYISKRDDFMRCLYCFEELKTEVSWENIILGTEMKHLCMDCKLSFQELNSPLCIICSTESTIKVCTDCKVWSNKYGHRDVLNKNYSIFKYNEFIQKYLVKWKYQGDYILIDGIIELIEPYVKQKLKFEKSFRFRNNHKGFEKIKPYLKFKLIFS